MKKLLAVLLVAVSTASFAGEDVACFKFVAAHPDTNQPHLEDDFDMKLVSPMGTQQSIKRFAASRLVYRVISHCTQPTSNVMIHQHGLMELSSGERINLTIRR